jgi:HEAT repeat protein
LRIIRRLFVFGLFLFVLPLQAKPRQSLSKSLAELKDADSRVRRTAFYNLFQPSLGSAVNAREGTLTLLREHPRDRESITQGLIDLLDRENSFIGEVPSGSLPESYGEYHASLIWSVATLRDGKAANALLGAIKNGGLATDGLVALGAAAIPAILRAVDSSDSGVRVEATMVLGNMALQRDQLGLSAANAEAIRSVLLRAVNDGEDSVRFAAVLSLESFVDASVRDAVQKAATVDTSERVRGAANGWLSKHGSE